MDGGARSMALALGVAALLGCGSTPGTARIERARYRWEGGAWGEIAALDEEPPGRAGARTLELCFDVPPLGVADPALLVGSRRGLTSARAGGVEIDGPFESGIVPLAPADGPQVACVTYAGWFPLRALSITAGSQRELVVVGMRAEVPQLAVGVVLTVIGLVLLVWSWLRETARPVRWLGVFALAMGVLSTSQAWSFRALFWPGYRLWMLATIFGLGAGPASLALFARDVFGDSPRRLLTRLSLAMFATTAALVAADLAEIASLITTYPLIYVLYVPLIGVGAWIVAARVRQGRRTASVFLASLAALVVVGAPDVVLGLMSARLAATGAFTSVGLLLFFLGMGFVVELQYTEQRRALEATTEQLRRQVSELEEKRSRIEALAEELRHQLERRSRELGDALAAGRQAATVVGGALAPGTVVDRRYRIESMLGRGAMGAVYEATRLTDGHRFAIKVVADALDPERARRFAREAEIAAKLRHANLVALVDVGIDASGILYLVMELVRGESLEAMRTRFGDRAWALPILRDVASGLAALHDAAIVHRDLKPANVLLDGSTGGAPSARIADFGIARPAPSLELAETRPDAAAAVGVLRSGSGVASPPGADPRALTQSGAWIGTPVYMAPEAATGEVSLPADVFALGLMMHEVLTGRYPFATPPFFAALARRLAPAAVSSDLEPELAELVAAALDLHPERRPTAAEIRARLAAAPIPDA